jgi:hypothetical protein
MATDAIFRVSVHGGRFRQLSGTLIKPTMKILIKLHSDMRIAVFWVVTQRVVIIP